MKTKFKKGKFFIHTENDEEENFIIGLLNFIKNVSNEYEYLFGVDKIAGKEKQVYIITRKNIN